MALFTADSVERVREAADIVEIISPRSDLRRVGNRWTGLCPFHDERTPSFSVNQHDKVYYCFGCEAKGDVFTFVQEQEGIGFGEAVEMLAQRYGVEVEREKEDPQEEARRLRRDRLTGLLDRAGTFYSNYLWDSPKAAKQRDYLKGRGLGEQVLRDFGVGLAPSDWGALLERAQRAGFRIEELRDAGMVRKGRQGGYYDAFRSRIIFPIRDRRGTTLGFGGRRITEDQKPKYVNSAETEIYHKSRILYGIDQARAAIAKAGRAVLVEGYTDVLALHQAGIKESVGVMGTAITDEQVAVIAGLADQIVLALDADSAGQEAMLRAQKIAEKRRMRIAVAAMPQGEDPAEMLAAEGGPERFRALLDGAVILQEFQVDMVLNATDVTSPQSRDRALAELAPVLGGMGEGATRDELVRRISDRLDIESSLVMRRLGEAPAVAPDRSGSRSGPGSAPEDGPARRRPAAPLTPRERRERALLSMCVSEPESGRAYLDRLTPAHMSSPAAVRALEWLRGHLGAPMQDLPPDDQELTALITELVARSEPVSPNSMEINFLQLEERRLEQGIKDAWDDDVIRVRLTQERARLVDHLARLEDVISSDGTATPA